MSAQSRSIAVVLAIVACQLAGCGGRSNLPPRAKVSGLVTLDGKPLEVGMVQFVPDPSKGNNGPVAVGAIDANGRYELMTDRQGGGGDGAVLGFHKVRVDARRKPKDETDTLPPSLIPARYNNPDSSGLSFEVKAVEINDIPLALKSK